MKKKISKFWLLTTSILGGITAVTIAANIVGNINAVTINWALNAETSKVVGEGKKTIYYHSDYTKKDANGNTIIDKKGKETYDSLALSEDGDKLTEEVAKEGFVLLKNDGALPLAKNTKVSLFGQGSAHIITSGTGSGETSGNKATMASALEKGGLSLVNESYQFYTTGAGKDYKGRTPGMHDNNPFVIGECPWNVIKQDASYSAMTNCDTALVVFSRNGGEGYDLANGASTIGYDFGDIICTDARTKEEGSLTGNNYLELNADERSVLSGLKALKDSNKIKNIVVLLNSANALQLDFLNKDICGVDYGIDACLWLGATGQSGLNALGPILSGDATPSGRLVDTYCYDNLREPSIYNFGHNAYSNFESDFLAKSKEENDQFFLNEKYYNIYREGIYVGYRYYETRYADYCLGNTSSFNYDDIVSHSFGSGLSYSNFEYSDFQVKEADDKLSFDVSVKVTNKGDYDAKEVVEVYASTPYSDYAKAHNMEKSAIELVGFNKTSLLKKNGGSETVKINVKKEYMASYDADFAKTYVLDEGDYYLSLGNGAHDALNRILRKQNADENKIVERKTTFTSDEDLVYKFRVDETDNTTFSKSSSTGKEITNQFEQADLNKYRDNGNQKIDYVSRKNWTASFDDSTLESMQESSITLKMTNGMYSDVKNCQYTAPEEAKNAKMPKMKQKNGLKLCEFVGVPLDGSIKKGNKEYTWDDLLDQVSYVEMRDLIIMAQHCTKVVPSVAKPGTSDQNGPCGFSSTFVGGGSGTSFPVSCLRASSWNKELAKKVGEHIGEDGLHSNCNGLYGPAANTHRNAYCGRNFEYYSEDPLLAEEFGAEEVKGIQSKGIIVYEKHFALNDMESHREGVGIWANEQSIREIYLEAFHGIMKKDGGNAHAAMSGFGRLGTIWTGNSINLMENVARGEWGFDGFVITDADSCNKNVINTGYMYAPRAITTGTDCYDGNNNLSRDQQFDAYSKDPYIVSCMRRATMRILYSVANSAAMNGTSPSSEVVEIMPWWQVLALSIMFGFIGLTLISGVMLVLNKMDIVKFPKGKEVNE